MNPVDRTKSFGKEFIKYATVDAVGTAMLGLGLYGKFRADGDAFHPLLNDSTVITSLLVVGAIVMVWYESVAFDKRKARFKKLEN